MTDLLIDLATAGVGGRVLEASDEYFAPKERLIADEKPVADAGRFTDQGRWTDGWVTRRRRDHGHEWAIVRLGYPGVLRHLVVDTTHITGDTPEAISIEAAHFDGDPNIVDLVRNRGHWSEIVPRSGIEPDHLNEFGVSLSSPVTHVRLISYPDGGIARLRCLGEPVAPPGVIDGSKEIDLAAVANGARIVDASHRAGNPNVLLRSSRARNAGDSWETPRRRGPGNEWAVVRLGAIGRIDRVVVDTSSVTGNAPSAIDVEAVFVPGAAVEDLWNADWQTLVEQSELGEDRVNTYAELPDLGEISHLRLNIHPDGAIARLRAYGTATSSWTG